ncbi:MAG TPA: glycosyltransferase [Bryobacteraceae bacterium]|jgi:ceramide glucosyltransferase|nr:glycosyltransferase [Bryobacteraceae bacterium]
MVIFLGVAAIPFIYYLIVIFSGWRYFQQPAAKPDPSYTPPVSILKPFRGIDPDAYENLASFCVLDYPEYEMVFCIDPDDDYIQSVIGRLIADFPRCRIRVLYGSGRVATNDKVAKLARLVNEAAHEVVVISDSDVRVRPDYLRHVVAPLRDPKVGAVTCLYVPIEIKTFTDHLQSVGMMSDFYAGVLIDWQLEGMKFALGPTIATTRARLNGFGGYPVLENRPADDLLVGRLIDEQGYQVLLIRYAIDTVCDYGSMRELLHKRLRWIVVMRHMRPWGHLGLLLTQGLPWSLAAIAVHPSGAVALGYLGGYMALRILMTWVIGIRGLGQKVLWRQLPLLPFWDAVAFGIWLVSFTRSSIRWRGADYYIREGQLVPVTPTLASARNQNDAG